MIKDRAKALKIIVAGLFVIKTWMPYLLSVYNVIYQKTGILVILSNLFFKGMK